MKKLGLLLVFLFLLNCKLVLSQDVEWSVYGRDLHGTRYISAKNITKKNIGQLEVAWTYRTGETSSRFKTKKQTSFEATPIVVDGVMYLSTPLGRVLALNPFDGSRLWEFDPEIRRDVTYGDFANRGVSTWLNKSLPKKALCRRTIYIATAQSQLIAIDAKKGVKCDKFGKKGIVDLRKGLRVPPFEKQAYTVTSPPAIANGLVVIGSSIADNSRPNPASGEIRAFDARTGKLHWTWDPIPQNPNDPAYIEWKGKMGNKTGGANAWSTISIDSKRDLVFIPTSSPAPDYYGVLRLGKNSYANSVVALRLSTGKLVWSFQTVHHDLWDYDNASQPTLVTIKIKGKEIPVVLQATKTGMLFVLNRENGKPVFPVEERDVPVSTIPNEVSWKTQPFTALTKPLSPHKFYLKDVWGITEKDRDSCRKAMKNLRNEGIFTPPSVEGTLVIPSNIGGAHWGGVAVDSKRQIAVVPVNRIAAMVQLIPREKFSRKKYRTEDNRLGHDYEYNMMRGTPYVMRRRLILSPSGLPCSPPPWGSLIAIDLKTGLKKWDVPLGSMTRPFPKEFASKINKNWGSINLGGPIVTASGIVFIGAALDRWLHAFDIETGKEIWRGPLPESGKATPMSYQLRSGEQFVVISVGGGNIFGKGDYLIAFRIKK